MQSNWRLAVNKYLISNLRSFMYNILLGENHWQISHLKQHDDVLSNRESQNRPDVSLSILDYLRPSGLSNNITAMDLDEVSDFRLYFSLPFFYSSSEINWMINLISTGIKYILLYYFRLYWIIAEKGTWLRLWAQKKSTPNVPNLAKPHLQSRKRLLNFAYFFSWNWISFNYLVMKTSKGKMSGRKQTLSTIN